MAESSTGSSTPSNRVAETAAYTIAVLAEMLASDPDVADSPLSDVHARRLRASIRDYTAALRETGAPPEQAVKKLKLMISTALGRGDPYPSRLMEAAVAWSIEEYFK